MKGIRKSVPTVRMAKNHLSLVIPCYRESERLPKFLESLLKTFKGSKSVDFLVVDDGTPLAEFEILKQKINHLLSNPQIQLLRYETNVGKGGAIQFGLKVAKGNYFGFVDADGATPAEEVFRTWNHINLHPEIDLLAGSRIIMMGRNVKKSFYRHVTNRIFSFYFSFIFRIQMYDPQCGCKIFKKSAYLQVIHKISDLRWLWDTQLLVLLIRNGFKIVEIPLDWQDIPGSKFSFLKDSFLVVFSVWKYRNIH